MTRPPVKKNRLTSMNITEISVVDVPANSHSRAPIAKRGEPNGTEGDQPMPKFSLKKYARNEDELDHEVENADDGYEADDGAEEGDDDGVYADEEMERAELEDALAEALNLVADAIEQDPEDEGVQKVAKALAIAADLLDDNDALIDAVTEAGEEIAKSQSRIASYEGQIRKMGAEPVAEVADEIDLAELPEPVRKMVEESRISAETALAEVAKSRAEKQRETIKKRVESAGIAQVEAVTDLMIRIEKGASDAKDAAFVLDIIKSAGNAAKNADLLEKLGERAGGDANQFDVKLAAAIDPILKGAAASGQSMTKEQAIAKAYEMNPQLYADYQAEIKARRG
ncbi:MAG: hypothetical protein EBZ50_07625 [Alphaproteobacteria bacterium]|nr:hypothetical protein [Alphaproteobacteria bacterium]